MRASSDAVIKVPIYDEYKKFKNYVHELNSELWKKATDSEEPDEKMYFEIKQVLEKESAAYCKTHRIFNEREIKQRCVMNCLFSAISTAYLSFYTAILLCFQKLKQHAYKLTIKFAFKRCYLTFMKTMPSR